MHWLAPGETGPSAPNVRGSIRGMPRSSCNRSDAKKAQLTESARADKAVKVVGLETGPSSRRRRGRTRTEWHQLVQPLIGMVQSGFDSHQRDATEPSRYQVRPTPPLQRRTQNERIADSDEATRRPALSERARQVLPRRACREAGSTSNHMAAMGGEGLWATH